MENSRNPEINKESDYASLLSSLQTELENIAAEKGIYKVPIIGVDESGRPAIKHFEYKENYTAEDIKVLAYGGTAYSERVRIGSWGIDLAVLGDRSQLSDSRLAFGSAQKDDKKFLILRELQDTQRRGGYPYTVLVDPGEDVRKKADYNDAAIIAAIMRDPLLKHLLFKDPEAINESMLKARLEQSYLGTSPQEDSVYKPLLEGARLSSNEVEEPTPEQISRAIAALPLEVRKGATFLVRGTKWQVDNFGANGYWEEE